MSDASPFPADLYESFFVPAIFAPASRHVLAAADPKPGEHALDLACGTGILARQLAPAVGKGGRVVGLDIRPGMLASARTVPLPDGAAVEWMEGDATALDLPARSFDLVVCQFGFQFFADRAAAAAEILRVLKPGGRVVIAVWQELDRQRAFGAFAEAELRHLAPLGVTRADIEAPFTLGDPDKLASILSTAGFRGVAVEPVTIEAGAPAENFVRNVETAYAAVMPQFAADPAAFERFVGAVEAELVELVEELRKGDRVAFAVHANLARAVKPGRG